MYLKLSLYQFQFFRIRRLERNFIVVDVHTFQIKYLSCQSFLNLNSKAQIFFLDIFLSPNEESLLTSLINLSFFKETVDVFWNASFSFAHFISVHLNNNI